jgi:hypothetical protein
MAHEGDLCNCEDCPDDPGLTCSYTGDDVSVLCNYVANAYRGELLLCPGGDNGEIGGLLHQLEPPQHYSHMGVFIANHDLIRNCTASPSRLTASEYYDGNVLGVKAPADGLPADHVQFGWPGTITQSVEQALYADRYAANDLMPPGSQQPYVGADLADLESSENPQKRYRIGALSFDNVDGYNALVVKPCPSLEGPLVREALNRVADEATKINAHYRFYAYTDGAVGQDLNRTGPATKVLAAIPDRDPVTGKWVDWADPNAVRWIDVPDTVPAVCSSFVWQAVQNAHKAGASGIKLDWAELRQDALGEAGGACRRSLAPAWDADSRDAFTPDGLYFYDEESRKRAANWLNGALSDKVYNSLKETLHGEGGIEAAVASAIDVVGKGAFIAAAVAGSAAVVALLAPVVTPAVALVLDAVFAEQLIELLYDMPQDIANQVCNSFAFDCHRGFPADTFCVDAAGNQITNIDSSNWSDDPGPGRAVSPDNIAMFWDAPGPSNPEQIQGIYGFNVPVQPISYVVRKPICRLVKSTGTATIRGQVTYNGKALIGAHVEAACQHTLSEAEGYRLIVRSGGQYKLVARYEDTANDVTLYGEAITGKVGDPQIAPGSTTTLNIAVTEPPKCNRKVSVTGQIRVDDVYLTGADHADATINKDLQVQWGVGYFNTVSGDWDIHPDDPAASARHTDQRKVPASVGDAQAALLIEASANADLSVEVKVTGSVNGLTESHTVHVADGATVPIAEFDLDNGGPFNDRAYFRNIQVTNVANNAL